MDEYDLFILDKDETVIDDDQQEHWAFLMAARRKAEDESHAETEPKCLIVDL